MFELWLLCLLIFYRVLWTCFEFCQLVFESSAEGASFYKESKDFVTVNKWMSVGFLIIFVLLEYVESRTTWWVKAIWLLGQSNFSLFTSRITCDRFGFERTRVSSLRISVFEMGEYAGELPRKFVSFHCLENESNVPKDHNTEGTENYPDLPRRSEVEIVVLEETETSPTKSLAVLQVTGGKKTMSVVKRRWVKNAGIWIKNV